MPSFKDRAVREPLLLGYLPTASRIAEKWPITMLPRKRRKQFVRHVQLVLGDINFVRRPTR